MTKLGSYISYIVGIIGFAGIIWTWASSSAQKDFDVIDLKKEVTEIKTNMATKNSIKTVADSLRINNIIIRNEMEGIAMKTDRLTRQLTRHLAKTVTPDSMRRIMEEFYEKKN